MSALVNALDNYTPSQIGQNGHTEYGWSNGLRESILQFSFQLTRITKEGKSVADSQGLRNLDAKLRSIMLLLIHMISSNNSVESKEYLKILYKMIGHTRDIVSGKGEYTLSYMMINVWYDFYPELAFFATKCLVDYPTTSEEEAKSNVHQYGSWKDIKYFCDFCFENGRPADHPLIINAVKILNVQLKKDALVTNDNELSLAARWAPREKSNRFGWLYEPLAFDYFPEFLISAKTPESFKKATLKVKTNYRHILSNLNRRLDTTQIKQCGHTWSEIDFNKVTSVTLSKQKKAFLNLRKDNSERYKNDVDRVSCANHFSSHIQKAINGEVEMKGKRVQLVDFVKQALEIFKNDSKIEKDLLNSQWRDNSSQNGALGNIIAMCDVSGSMSFDNDSNPLYASIALGIRVAEKSKLGKRVMTFSANPNWINLEPYDDFTDMVKQVYQSNSGLNTNFYAALDMILDAIIVAKLPPEEVQDMMLVIFSDMQIDQGDKTADKSMYAKIDTKYAEAGMRLFGKPFKAPHILFWNLKSGNGFPNLSSQPNTSMMSGFSPALLNIFCDKGIEALQSATPWSLLEESLKNERYRMMSDKVDLLFSIE